VDAVGVVATVGDGGVALVGEESSSTWRACKGHDHTVERPQLLPGAVGALEQVAQVMQGSLQFLTCCHACLAAGGNLSMCFRNRASVHIC